MKTKKKYCNRTKANMRKMKRKSARDRVYYWGRSPVMGAYPSPVEITGLSPMFREPPPQQMGFVAALIGMFKRSSKRGA